MEQAQIRAHFPSDPRQNSQVHQTSRNANSNNSNNCQTTANSNCQPNKFTQNSQNQFLSDKDLHVMILHFLYNEANCPHAAREFIQNSSELAHIQQQLGAGNGEISLYSPHLNTAKMTVSQILRRFFEEHPELSPDQSFGIMRISPTKLGLSEGDRSFRSFLGAQAGSNTHQTENSTQVIVNSNQAPNQVTNQVTNIQNSNSFNNAENIGQQNYIPITSAQGSFFKSPTSSSKRKKQVPRKVQLNSVKNIVDFKESGKSTSEASNTVQIRCKHGANTVQTRCQTRCQIRFKHGSKTVQTRCRTRCQYGANTVQIRCQYGANTVP